jgi:hypothetical protein
MGYRTRWIAMLASLVAIGVTPHRELQGKVGVVALTCSDDTSVDCPVGQHKMVFAGPAGQFVFDSHDCLPPTLHSGPPCGSGLFGLEDVINATEAELAAMVSAPGSNVVFNAERGAVQLVGCYGLVDASIPIEFELMAQNTQ